MMWGKTDLPQVVFGLCYRGGLIMGSQAKAYVEGKEPLVGHDWDIMVPFAVWHQVCGVIPRTAVPNGFRGWRFSIDGVEVDVWPDDLQRCLQQASRHKGERVYALDIKTGFVFSAEIERV